MIAKTTTHNLHDPVRLITDTLTQFILLSGNAFAQEHQVRFLISVSDSTFLVNINWTKYPLLFLKITFNVNTVTLTVTVTFISWINQCFSLYCGARLETELSSSIKKHKLNIFFHLSSNYLFCDKWKCKLKKCVYICKMNWAVWARNPDDWVQSQQQKNKLCGALTALLDSSIVTLHEFIWFLLLTVAASKKRLSWNMIFCKYQLACWCDWSFISSQIFLICWVSYCF